MLKQSEYMALDAVDLGAGLKNKDFSCVEITRCAIDRANEVNPHIHAIVYENFDLALVEAEKFDTQNKLFQKSRVAGVPFLIKDLTPVKDLPCQFGSKLFNGFIAKQNANIVDSYLEAGLNIFGKTNTPEWGVTLTTEPVANDVCRNPWNIDYSTGGSSGGAAAAVASGISPVANASDGGGSIRIPASCCGLFGLKPSRGLTTIEDELSACWSGLSVSHVVSQTVRDSAAFLDIVRLNKAKLFPLPSSPTSFLEDLNEEPDKLRIGIHLEHPMGEVIDSDCLDAVKKTAKICSSLGHEVELVDYSIDYTPVVSAMSRIINTHVYQSVAPRLLKLDMEIEDSPLELSTKIMAKSGKKVDAASYLVARDLLTATEQQMSDFHQEFDIVISPVLTKTPAPLAWLDMNNEDMREYSARFRQFSGFAAIYNGTGQPSMSMPLHMSSAGLPVGVMLSSGWGCDALLLRLARQIEQASPWQRMSGYAPEAA